MKKLITLLLLLTLSTASFSQSSSVNSELKTEYLKKSKEQGKIGAILLLSGAGVAFIGSVVVTLISHSLPAGAITMAVGLISIPFSIPFFTEASKFKKKALRLSFKNETVPQIQNKGFANKSLPSLTLRIRLK